MERRVNGTFAPGHARGPGRPKRSTGDAIRTLVDGGPDDRPGDGGGPRCRGSIAVVSGRRGRAVARDHAGRRRHVLRGRTVARTSHAGGADRQTGPDRRRRRRVGLAGMQRILTARRIGRACVQPKAGTLETTTLDALLRASKCVSNAENRLPYPASEFHSDAGWSRPSSAGGRCDLPQLANCHFPPPCAVDRYYVEKESPPCASKTVGFRGTSRAAMVTRCDLRPSRSAKPRQPNNTPPIPSSSKVLGSGMEKSPV